MTEKRSEDEDAAAANVCSGNNGPSFCRRRGLSRKVLHIWCLFWFSFRVAAASKVLLPPGVCLKCVFCRHDAPLLSNFRGLV